MAFRRDRRGNVAMLWALLGSALVGLVGLSVDFTRAQAIQTQLQNAADGAALAAARAPANLTLAERTTAARAFFDAEAGNYALTSNFAMVAVGADGYRVTASMPMPGGLSHLVQNDDWTIGVSSEAARGGLNLEIALVLDTTGSMSGSKIADLRTAATDLVDTLISDSQTPYYSKAALVSYSVGVNAGSYAAAVRGAIPAANTITGASWSTGAAKVVTGATRAAQAVITSPAHGFTNGQVVYITGVNGMTQLNNKYYTVANVTANTFKIKNSSGNYVNSTGYNNFSLSPSSSIRRCQTNTCEIVVTANAHGFANGAYAFITGVNGMTQINNATGSGSGTAWQVASAAANTFVLSGSTGPSYGAYTSGGSAYCTTTGCEYHRFTNASGGTNVFRVSTCTTERIGANAYTDAGPGTSLLGLNYPSTASNGACPANTILPLTSDRAVLNARIASLAASGYTAGQIGAAWGWYMLAPNFSSLWASASQPAAYGAPETMKIMVFMTDGAFNTNYCNGVMAQNAGGGSNVDQINCNATNGDPLVQAQSLCTAMKNRGIIIYTVGFQMQNESQASRDMMTQCATDNAHAFMADDGQALQDAFAQIGQSITQLRLTH